MIVILKSIFKNYPDKNRLDKLALKTDRRTNTLQQSTNNLMTPKNTGYNDVFGGSMDLQGKNTSSANELQSKREFSQKRLNDSDNL